MLLADESTKAERLEEAYLQLTLMDELSWRIPIKAEVSNCTVESWKFTQRSVAIEYVIKSEAITLPIPVAIPIHNCLSVQNLPLIVESINTSHARVSPEKAITIDTNSNVITVWTEDQAFSDQQVTIVLTVEQDNSVRKEKVFIDISFKRSAGEKVAINSELENLAGLTHEQK